MFKDFKKIIKDYHLSILVAGNTFYLLLMLLPLSQLNENISINIDSLIGIFNMGIIFLVNIIFVSSKYLSSLRMTSDLIYEEIPLRKSIKERIKSFVLVIVLLLIIISLLIISFGMIKLWINVFGSLNYLILKIIEFIVSYAIILLISMLIFKYTLPVFVKFSNALKISLVLTLIWILFSTVYQFVIKLLENFVFWNILNETIVFIYFLYFLNYFIVLSFIYYYIKIKEKQKSMHNND